MNPRAATDKMTFIERNFDIHGELNGVVYHTKRNGKVEKYPLSQQSYYQRTALVIRNESIRRAAAAVTNPGADGYSAIMRRLYYYTPYILHQGDQEFMGETAFYIRKLDKYKFCWANSPSGFTIKAGKRSKIELNFDQNGEFTLNCSYNGELYCQRSFIITDGDLDELYAAWLAENLESIIGEPEPEYPPNPVYRRGLRSRRNWILALTGKCGEESLYTMPSMAAHGQRRQRPLIYHRRIYNHCNNEQSKRFLELMPQIAAEWQALSKEEKERWNKMADKKSRGCVSGYNLFLGKRMEN